MSCLLWSGFVWSIVLKPGCDWAGVAIASTRPPIAADSKKNFRDEDLVIQFGLPSPAIPDCLYCGAQYEVKWFPEPVAILEADGGRVTTYQSRNRSRMLHHKQMALV